MSKKEITNENLIIADENAFAMEEILMHDDKTCTIKYNLVAPEGTAGDMYKGVLKASYQCTESLQGLINDLKVALCTIRNVKEDEKPKINVTGVKVEWKKGKETFIITGKQVSVGGQKMTFDTHKVHKSDNNYAIENEVFEIIGDIQISAYRYLFMGDKGQLDLGLNSKEVDNEADTDNE